MTKSKTEASGTIAGFLFQPDRALLHLSQLKERDHYVSIEYIDDVGVHDNLDNVLISEQDKHSIKRGGSTFQNSSIDLWKTIVIWIKSYKEETVNDKTKFICSTNKKINIKSFLYKFPKYTLEEFKTQINNFLIEKEKSLRNKQIEALKSDNSINHGTTLETLIKNIKLVIEDIGIAYQIIKNIEIEDEQTISKIKDNLLNYIQIPNNNLSSERVYEELLGWLNGRCKDLWSTQQKAIITKEEFNQKVDIIKSSEVLNQLIFRAIDEIKIGANEIELYSDRLFVRQLDLIERFKKRDFILEAINDYLCYEKEELRITKKGTITSTDFQKFTENNEQRWKTIFLSEVTKEPHDYDDIEQNDLAIKIYDKVMGLNIKFKNIYDIDISNKYIKTGSFHKMADIPSIGWHPDWENKFKKNEK